jgi:hypothetical protein
VNTRVRRLRIRVGADPFAYFSLRVCSGFRSAQSGHPSNSDDVGRAARCDSQMADCQDNPPCDLPPGDLRYDRWRGSAADRDRTRGGWLAAWQFGAEFSLRFSDGPPDLVYATACPTNFQGSAAITEFTSVGTPGSLISSFVESSLTAPFSGSARLAVRYSPGGNAAGWPGSSQPPLGAAHTEHPGHRPARSATSIPTRARRCSCSRGPCGRVTTSMSRWLTALSPISWCAPGSHVSEFELPDPPGLRSA